MLFKKYFRKHLIKILCEVSSHAEEAAGKFADDFIKNDKYYDNNIYRGPALGYIHAVNWMSNEILKRI